MKKHTPSKLEIPGSKFGDSLKEKVPQRGGFTLVEVILVMVVLVIISGISLPYFSGSFRGTQLRSAARTIDRMARYTRSMAIMREETLTMALNPNTLELFMGAPVAPTSDAEADGELDQDVLKRLGYVKDGAPAAKTGNLDKEVHHFLPDRLTVRNFEKNRTDDDTDSLYTIEFYPNGQCEWFEIEFEDNRGSGIKLEIDPISGKIRSEFIQ